MLPGLDRRQWLQLTAMLSLASESRAQAPAQGQPAATQPPKISKEMLNDALQLLGLDFTPDQQEMMLPCVIRFLNTYEALRKIEVPLDTEPATRFYPTKPVAKPAKFSPTADKPAGFNSVEDLAF